MRSASISLAVALLGCSTGVLSQLSKPILTNPTFDGTLENTQNNDLVRDLPAHSYTSTNWDNNYIPKSFWSIFYAQSGFTYSVWDVETRNIKYSDCAHNSAVSRHKSSSLSWDAISQLISRVPVGLRQYTANVLVLPNSALSVAAYASGNTLVFVDNYHKLGVWAHEGTHILDATALVNVVVENGYSSGTRYSNTAMWEGAYNKDTHIITPYGKAAGQVENFADVGRWSISDWTLSGGLSAYTPSRGSVANQLGNFNARLKNIILPGTCTGKVASTQAVNKNTGARIASSGKFAAAEADWLKAPVGAESVPVISEPEGLDWTPIPHPLDSNN